MVRPFPHWLHEIQRQLDAVRATNRHQQTTIDGLQAANRRQQAENVTLQAQVGAIWEVFEELRAGIDRRIDDRSREIDQASIWRIQQAEACGRSTSVFSI